jgi:predicted phosphodiesterase
MRVFALSDIHTDHEHNKRWVAELSHSDYRQDVLILAGDVSDSLSRLGWTLGEFARCFAHVLYVPGNHDLWVLRERELATSLDKHREVCAVVSESGGSLQGLRLQGLTLVPLLGWYDYSFGEPGPQLRQAWMDYHACRWPEGWTQADIAAHFTSLNTASLNTLGLNAPGLNTQGAQAYGKVITYSHFLPRIDVMPSYIPEEKRFLYPVLGSSRLDAQLRQLGSSLHIYGHSHVNRRVEIEGITYINNAFGYPHETRIAAKRLLCVHTL